MANDDLYRGLAKMEIYNKSIRRIIRISPLAVINAPKNKRIDRSIDRTSPNANGNVRMVPLTRGTSLKNSSYFGWLVPAGFV